MYSVQGLIKMLFLKEAEMCKKLAVFLLGFVHKYVKKKESLYVKKKNLKLLTTNQKNNTSIIPLSHVTIA